MTGIPVMQGLTELQRQRLFLARAKEQYHQEHQQSKTTDIYIPPNPRDITRSSGESQLLALAPPH